MDCIVILPLSSRSVVEQALLPFNIPIGVDRWIQYWYPSRTLRNDPLESVSASERYLPVPVAGWKLTPRMTAVLLSLRQPKLLTFSSSGRLAVIVPFRDREAHLAVLLPRIRRVLIDQGISYKIIVVEQEPGMAFNRGALINAGMSHAAEGCDYFCLHDVDAIPVDANYLCPSQPLRLVTRLIDSKNGVARPPRYFSGVITLAREHAYDANGFSNQYWGWGKEDDDFLFRLLFTGHVCYFDTAGVFEDLHNPAHQQVNLSNLIKPKTVRRNRQRRSLLVRGLLDPADDGLNTLTARVLKNIVSPEYERLVVALN